MFVEVTRVALAASRPRTERSTTELHLVIEAGRRRIERRHIDFGDQVETISRVLKGNEGPHAPVIATVVEHRCELSTCIQAVASLEGFAPSTLRFVAEYSIC